MTSRVTWPLRSISTSKDKWKLYLQKLFKNKIIRFRLDSIQVSAPMVELSALLTYDLWGWKNKYIFLIPFLSLSPSSFLSVLLPPLLSHMRIKKAKVNCWPKIAFYPLKKHFFILGFSRSSCKKGRRKAQKRPVILIFGKRCLTLFW